MPNQPGFLLGANGGNRITAVLTSWDGVNSNFITVPPVAALPTGVFQDAFQVGQAMERRLNLVQLAVASVPNAPSTTEPALADALNVAKGGIAELRTWAGATTVPTWPVATGATPTSFVVRVGGMSYARDFGMHDATDMSPVSNAFVFVYGPPWVAECAAGLRADCPALFAAQYEQTGTAQDVTALPFWPARYSSELRGRSRRCLRAHRPAFERNITKPDRGELHAACRNQLRINAKRVSPLYGQASRPIEHERPWACSRSLCLERTISRHRVFPRHLLNLFRSERDGVRGRADAARARS